MAQISHNKFWVVERTHFTYEKKQKHRNHKKFHKKITIISIYEVDLTSQTKRPSGTPFIDNNKSSEDIPFFQKRPVKGLVDHDINIEGMTLGPCDDGKRLLIMVSDNNFSCRKKKVHSHVLVYKFEDDTCY